MFIWLLIVFGLGLLAQRWFGATKDHRSEPAGAADLLGWGFMVGPGVVLQKDGSFLAGWRFRGPDLSSATTEEVNLLSKHINDGLLPFADGWMLHVDAIRRPSTTYAPEGYFPDPVTRVIDWERRQAYERVGGRYESESFMVITYLPPEEKYDKVGKHFMKGEATETGGWEKHYSDFVQGIKSLEDRLNARLSMDRLSSDELATHLHRCWTALDHPVLCPAHGSYLDLVLSDQLVVAGTKPKVGKNHVRVIAIHGYPGESYSGMLGKLMEEPFEYRWSNRVIPLGREIAEKEIKKRQLGWFQKRKGAGSWIGEMGGKEKNAQQMEDDKIFQSADAYAMAESAKRALAENSEGSVRFCHFNSNLVVMGENAAEVEKHAGRLVKVLNDTGFTARLETINAFDAFLGTLPGDGYHNLRRPVLSSRNITDMLPFTSVWPGYVTHPSPFYPADSPPLMWTDTAGSTPFRLTPFFNDIGHTLVIGSTGGGKSTLMASMVAQFQRYPNSQVFVFDKGYSFWLLAAASGGEHYDIAPGTDGLNFQPLRGVDNPQERVWAVDWVEILMALQGVKLTAPMRSAVDEALTLVGAMPAKMRTLSGLLMQLQDPAMRDALKPYTGSGQYGLLLDADTDGLSEGSFQVFEMHKLMDLGDTITIPVLLYIFHRLEQRLDGRPTMVVIEEAWQPLTNDLFAGRIKEWLLTWRKRNAAVMLVTQTLAQLYSLQNRHIILDSCPTRFLLPNPLATTESQAAMYRDVGLNDKEIQTISEATPKREYYFTNPDGSRKFSLGLGPVTLAFIANRRGMSLEATMKRAQELAQKHGPRWPGVWLEEVGQVEASRKFYEYLGGGCDDVTWMEEGYGRGSALPEPALQ